MCGLSILWVLRIISYCACGSTHIFGNYEVLAKHHIICAYKSIITTFPIINYSMSLVRQTSGLTCVTLNVLTCKFPKNTTCLGIILPSSEANMTFGSKWSISPSNIANWECT